MLSGAVADCDSEAPEPSTPSLREPPSIDISGEERVLQDIVYEVFAQGVWRVDHACAPPSRKELVKAQPGIRLAVTAALSCKECDRAVNVLTRK